MRERSATWRSLPLVLVVLLAGVTWALARLWTRHTPPALLLTALAALLVGAALSFIALVRLETDVPEPDEPQAS